MLKNLSLKEFTYYYCIFLGVFFLFFTPFYLYKTNKIEPITFVYKGLILGYVTHSKPYLMLEEQPRLLSNANDKITPIKKSLLLSIDEVENYIVHQDKIIENKLDDLAVSLLEEVELFQDKEHTIELIKGAILYHSLRDTKELFKEFEEKDKIKLTTLLLSTVAELETGPYDYRLDSMSQTEAFGIFQINGTTLANVVIDMVKDYGFDYFNVDISHLNTQSLQNAIKSQVYDYALYNVLLFDKEFKQKNESKKIYQLTKFHTKFINAFSKYLNETDNVNATYYKDELKTKEKKYDLSVKIINTFKNPSIQAFYSAKTLEMKKKHFNIKNTENTYASTKNEIKKLLQRYNADTKIVKNKNGKEMKYYEVFAYKGLAFFEKNIEYMKMSSL